MRKTIQRTAARGAVFGTVAMAVAAFGAQTAHAQSDSCNGYPSKPIELVTHAGTGGGTDVTARMVALKGAAELGTELPIVNKKGGGGVIAHNYLNSRPTDGYTIAFMTGSHVGSIVRGKSPFTIDDVMPVVRAAIDPQLFMVKEGGRFETGQDLVDTMKDEELKFGVVTIPGTDGISTFTFADEGGLKLPRMVPFDGGGAIVAAIIGGDIDVGVINLSEGEAAIDAGDLKPLIVLNDSRMAAVPDVVTSFELGIEAQGATIRGVFAKKGTPQCVIDILEENLLEAMEDPIYQNFMKTVGLDPSSPAGSEVWGNTLRRMHDNSKKALTAMGFIK